MLQSRGYFPKSRIVLESFMNSDNLRLFKKKMYKRDTKRCNLTLEVLQIKIKFQKWWFLGLHPDIYKVGPWE